MRKEGEVSSWEDGAVLGRSALCTSWTDPPPRCPAPTAPCPCHKLKAAGSWSHAGPGSRPAGFGHLCQRPEPLPLRGATQCQSLRFTIPTGSAGTPRGRGSRACTDRDTAGTLAFAHAPPTWDFKSWGNTLKQQDLCGSRGNPDPGPASDRGASGNSDGKMPFHILVLPSVLRRQPHCWGARGTPRSLPWWWSQADGGLGALSEPRGSLLFLCSCADLHGPTGCKPWAGGDVVPSRPGCRAPSAAGGWGGEERSG